MSDPPAVREDASLLLVVAVGKGDRQCIRQLLEEGLADAMYCNGLPLLVASATGQSVIVQDLVSCGAYIKHPEVLRLASRISTATQILSDAKYLNEWADTFESWNRDGVA